MFNNIFKWTLFVFFGVVIIGIVSALVSFLVAGSIWLHARNYWGSTADFLPFYVRFYPAVFLFIAWKTYEKKKELGV